MSHRWIWIGGIIILLIAFVIWRTNAPEMIVDVVYPKVQPLRASIEEQAITHLPQDHLISMPISGWVERIELREGDRVAEGQIVARLETDDLVDRVRQAQQRIAVLETKIAETQDHRLEQHMLVEARAVVKAIEETVRAAEEQLEGSLAIYEFAKQELERIKGLSEADALAQRELSAAKTEYRKTSADYRSDVLELAALKTLAAVSYIGPQYITDLIDRKSFQVESYRRQLEEAQAQLEIEKRNLARAELTSPIDGVILNRYQSRRQYLQAGVPLLSIGKLDEMEVVAEVLTEQAIHIAPGDPVEIFGEGLPGGPVQGEVLRVYPAGFEEISSLGVEQQRVHVTVALSERPARLGVGFRIYVRIYYDEVASALTLPRTSLFRSPQGQWQVMVVREGVTVLQPIEIGLMNDQVAQVLGRIDSNDPVIAHPTREITSGMKVAIEVAVHTSQAH